jgi:hypothetical protein
MRQFLTYIKLVGERAFEKTMWLFHLVEFALVLGSLKDFVPWYAWACVFLIDIFVSGYRVWADALKQEGELKAQLSEHNNRVPKFDVSIGGITHFTIRSLITETEKKVEAARVAAGIASGNTQAIANTPMSVIEQLASSRSSMLGMFGGESDKEKYDRFNDHLAALRKYEKKLENLYLISPTITSSRSDNNVEVTLSAANVIEMTVENYYVSKHVPSTHAPGGMLGSSLVDYVPNIKRPPSRTYLNSYGNGTAAFSKISSINAQRYLRIFEDELYIEVNDGTTTLELEFTVHSEKRDNAQHLKKSLDLTEAETKELK